MKSTEERLKRFGLESENIKVLHFPEREEYIQWMKAGHTFLSCARSEGFNLPLIEAIACGTPSICSNWGAQLEFANGVSYLVDVPNEKAPDKVVFLSGDFEFGVWGEPDFDHLKHVMRKVYNEYADAKSHALKMSEKVRDEYTWDNAAKKAEKIIKELVDEDHKKIFKSAKPKVSFVTSFYNVEKYVDDLANSVLGQTLEDWEWIITDDWSKDNTKEKLDELQKRDRRIKYIEQEFKQEIYWNPHKYASGELIFHLGSDDQLVPKTGEVISHFFDNNPDISCVHPSGNYYHNNFDSTNYKNSSFCKFDDYETILEKHPIYLENKSGYERVGFMFGTIIVYRNPGPAFDFKDVDLKLGKHEDVLRILRLEELGNPLFLNRTLYKVRMRDDSNTGSWGDRGGENEFDKIYKQTNIRRTTSYKHISKYDSVREELYALLYSNLNEESEKRKIVCFNFSSDKQDLIREVYYDHEIIFDNICEADYAFVIVRNKDDLLLYNKLKNIEGMEINFFFINDLWKPSFYDFKDSSKYFQLFNEAKEHFKDKTAFSFGTYLYKYCFIKIGERKKKLYKMFKTKLEIIGIAPKVTFEPLVDYKDFLLVRIKDSNDNIKYESWFDDLKVNHSYWISAASPVDQVTFEVLDNQNQCLYTETFDGEIIETVEYQESHQGMELYQDQYVNGTVIVEGKRECSSRYDAMKKVFEKYNRPFTILDIGANFGYYSIRAATEYDATAIMVESENNEIKTLLNLCERNNCRNKLTVLQTRLNLYKLKEISKCEHFDVILALNILHHFDNEELLEVCEIFTKLGDNLILETPPVEDSGACGQNNLKTIIDFFSNKDKIKLGEFKRHTSNTFSEMVCLKTSGSVLEWPFYEYEKLFDREGVDVEGMKNRGVDGAKPIVESDFNSKKMRNPRKKEVLDWIPGINLHTFINLNGIYPNVYNLIKKLENRNVFGDYKWDNSNKDIMTHNFILNGSNLHIIDFDDTLIGSGAPNDQLQLEITINEIKKCYSYIDKPEEEKIKINLGCGNDIKPDYINIDRYNNTGNVDLKSDLADLPFQNNSVDEIYTSHVLEHIGIHEIYSVLEEWKRVLVLNGKLVLRLPNLETEVNIWLNASDDKKWSELHRIFGSQSHEGNTHFCGFNLGSLKSFLERFNFEIKDLITKNFGYGQEIQCIAIKKADTIIDPPHYICHFVDGPYMEVKGGGNDKGFYLFDFLDPDSESSVHQSMSGINTWTRPSRRYFTNWFTQIKRNGKLVYEHAFDCEGKNVMISMDSRSLGDTIAWMPYAEEFRKKNKCNVLVSSFWNHLFKDHETYKNLNFIEPGTVVDMLYASYSIGCYDDDLNKNKVNWRITNLQKVAADTLGLDYKEIVTDIGIKPGSRPIKEKYVTLSEHSTFQCKYWNHKDGWQTVVDYLNDIGYKVMVVSKEKTNLKNIINKTNSSIQETITNIYHSEMFLGVSAGPSWLAWALRVPVVLISGYSAEIGEFSTGVERIINKEVCNSCFNALDFPFDRGDWNWCPRLKGTVRQFECTKKIEPKTVIKAINKIIKEKRREIKFNETSNYFYCPPDSEMKDLRYEVIDFDWKNFQQSGPSITAYHEIFIQHDYKHEGCKVEKGDLVVDIGANIGVFTRYASVYGAEKILSFEAEKNNFDYLLKNKPEICSAFNLAISDNNNIEDLYVSKLEGSHTLLGDVVTDERTLQEIQCITLNKIFETHKLDKIDFLKMDIEGAELKAFDGITDENLAKIRKISIEYHHNIFDLDKDVRKKFIERFIRLGFRAYTLHLRDDYLNMLYFWKQ